MKRPISLLSVVLALALPLILSDCMTDAGQSNSAVTQPATSASAGEQPSSSAALAAADAPSANSTSDDYRIAPRDIIEISVFQVQDLSKTVQVSDDGNISLPLIGKTKVAGRTTHDTEEFIASKLRKKYLQSPQVSVFVKQYGQRITVSGEVKTPRVLAIEGKMTLTQAIANGGGLSDLADAKRVHIARASNGHIDDEVYNFDDIQAGKANDPVLQGGDLVVAEQSGVRVVLKNLKDMLPFAVLAAIL